VGPTFAGRIKRGGPVTVTHPEMTRFFMEISEAAILIIQAAAMTQGNDLFMLEMGEPVKIDDLARRMIQMRGLRPDVDIEIVYTGVRSGEKLHEELVLETEGSFETEHPMIRRIQTRHLMRGKVELTQLYKLAEGSRTSALVERVMDLCQDVEDRHPIAVDGTAVSQ
jgi:FlaA1/EpsC-like NDP-sugar epimerase